MTVHDFTPTRYHNTFGSHQPVLTIRDGDVVRTSTVDAAGCDASGLNVTARGNMFDPAYTMALRVPKARLEDVLTSQTDRL